MLTVASRAPSAEGVKRTWKVVDAPAATGETGWLVTLKSAAWVPLMVTGVVPRVRGPSPVL